MPLSASGLKGELSPEIVAKLTALFPIEDASVLQSFADALAEAIANKVVAHIVANAQVSVPLVQSGLSTKTGTVS